MGLCSRAASDERRTSRSMRTRPASHDPARCYEKRLLLVQAQPACIAARTWNAATHAVGAVVAGFARVRAVLVRCRVRVCRTGAAVRGGASVRGPGREAAPLPSGSAVIGGDAKT